jgi:hypothetical protein
MEAGEAGSQVMGRATQWAEAVDGMKDDSADAVTKVRDAGWYSFLTESPSRRALDS